MSHQHFGLFTVGYTDTFLQVSNHLQNLKAINKGQGAGTLQVKIINVFKCLNAQALTTMLQRQAAECQAMKCQKELQ